MSAAPVIEVEHLVMHYGDTVIHEDINLSIQRGEVYAIAGVSGCGKSTLLRAMVMLAPITAGHIRVFGEEITQLEETAAHRLRQRWAMMFQGGALFSGLSVAENVALPLKEHTQLSAAEIAELVQIKIAFAGLPADAASKFPRELSGGLKKRAALARAIALDPELLFLDEPSAGLDPLAASALDTLILNLQQSLKLTIVIVTHDLDMLWRVSDRVAILGEKRVLAVDSMHALSTSSQPLVREYFQGPRGRVIKEQYGS